MPGIFDGLADEPRTRTARCAVAVLAAKLDPEDSTAFLEVVRNEDVPAVAIRDRLVKAGHPIAKDSLWRHRRGDCKCPREATK